ncbi:N-acetyl-1-D-myo-inositol-2-amino-2-deoxy-alpha-D-glucopyranoside deacetylase [Streptomyces sp. 2224.1]|uniref:N-acetyl-1-D-myo-inositol-2-amino-2-deoxy-alpha- D-glucopyranoside deacetylase n=1 Tax=unclassified Streptomyces TaxID=2593676 RepID=UPI00088CC4AB|nr:MULTISPECIES: N-acetyl-1-D-myo-inositol-2-amino-2-deoxy-alpha-D-glucopyranoside deacetylase [unclassified Streptomyces]PBC84868.1 N-acetyl-1-D-myo-inositol-2-amino-2-deoxy-alpha-D-glucopyranoside deacetylase [Streptomyces sp. 2321.6]SDR25420.1 N-acetyl-1-D-myo-inositol-2-amino-2-deoxy-alpha-D-glucopyranoside deacetylase [Streptomyces sp. KS_16]SEB59908.1 N-acetyl-1-D-myo-inositol-2-amino-2-deoxy-alpha-D-glucopyranoside deacetylase [Streptomyces sp. 2224.1]SED47492.1 N-acetyl-1-D-myo-inositol
MSPQPAPSRSVPSGGSASRPAFSRRLLLVHAHPDDESIVNGVTMAKYAAEGAHVTLVTCTLGEEGEVIPPELAHLAPDRDDTLGPYRAGELAAAMEALGVTDHRFLGGPGRYRDSGMMGAVQNERPDAFWQAPLDEAAADLVAVIREVRPQVLVAYDPHGGYGHPDHIQAHRVAMRGAELAARADFRPELGRAHAIAKIYWNCTPRSVVEEGFARLHAAGHRFPGVATVDDVPGVVPDSEVTAALHGDAAQIAAKTAAMRAHYTQIAVDGPFFALSNDLGQPLFGSEHYRLVQGVPGAAVGAHEDDLFAGVGDMADMEESVCIEEAAE